MVNLKPIWLRICIFKQLLLEIQFKDSQNCRIKFFFNLQVGEIQDDIATLEQNDNFLFDKQVIQDERLLNLEVRSDETADELKQIDDSIQGEFIPLWLIK